MESYFYQYGVGGVVFVVGLAFAARQGYVGLSGRGLRNLILLLGGLAFYMALQGYLQFAPMCTADAVKFEGKFERKQVLGQGIDYAIMVAYFLAILAVGTWFGRRQKTIKDFFFGGQRFSWWLISFSLVATLIGSYSFVKYSRAAYQYGLASSQTYLNDWFWMPLLIFGWLPIFYFSRLTSVPEYFERRFGPSVRLCATVLILLYLVGYVGVNLFTMGKVFNGLLGWNILTAAVVVACVSAAYVTFGGQTSVIMTDLFQGVMLLTAGLLILGLSVWHLGGLEDFWTNLPRGNRVAFHNFNKDPSFPSAGIFWQDAMANSAMFYFANQGILMRFTAAKSVAEARKAAIFVGLVLMPVAACVVAGGGWAARALVHAGLLPELEPGDAFFVATEFISRPGIFGLVVAALTAALMSTVDTLATAVSAIVVNDVYKVYVRPAAGEKELLLAARASTLGVLIVGVALVPTFMMFESIYAAHGAFTAAVTPPLVVALLLSVFWRRFTRAAALATMIGGAVAIAVSGFVPEVIKPFAHGVPMKEADGLLAGFTQYKFMRALFGLAVSGVIAMVVALLTRPERAEHRRGLVWGTVGDALRHYKGMIGGGGAIGERCVGDSPHVEGRAVDVERRATRALARAVRLDAALPTVGAGLSSVRISRALAEALDAAVGDLVYLADRRRWLGGLHSAHAVVESVTDDQADRVVEVDPDVYVAVVGGRDQPVRVERLY